MTEQRTNMARRPKKHALGVPEDVARIRAEIRRFMDSTDPAGRCLGNVKCGVYAFFDYDEEPIYVGQTIESLRQRIGRHLTNQRTDAVAMNVLDPFEVAYIEIWPFFDLEPKDAGNTLDKAEYAVFQLVLRNSALHAVLNEREILPKADIDLPQSYRSCIIPPDIFASRRHPDVRIARRAATVARLAQVISERDVSPGLRRALLTQSRRLERLARTRLADFGPVDPETESAGDQMPDPKP